MASAKPDPDHLTGIVYDARMRYHFQAIQGNQMHPEDPRRIAKIMLALETEDLIDSSKSLERASEYPRRVDARDVTDEEVLRVHSREHLAWIKRLKTLSDSDLKALTANGESIYVCQNTEIAANLAAGGTVDICKAVMRGELKNGFAVVRPPGHHAEHSHARGFCMYNNVSIAAEALLNDPEFADKCRKILIVDWDIHHGNGIQLAHFKSSNVLYISLHRNDEEFYPRGTKWGAEIEGEDRDNETYGNREQIGTGAGHGYNINIPWSQGGMGDGDYIFAFDRIVLPVAREYDPDIILVASGFDAAAGDPLGACYLSDGGYAYLTHQLMGIGSGKVVVVLEGGYNMTSISVSAVGVVKALLGRQLPKLPNSLPTFEGVQDVLNVVDFWKERDHWKCLQSDATASRTSVQSTSKTEIIRQWQMTQMWDRHELYQLYINVPNLPSQYNKSTLATPGLGSRAVPLLLIIHDPAEPVIGPDPISGEDHLRAYPDDKAVITDQQSVLHADSYIDEAIRMGFDIIDIHLPHTDPATSGYQSSDRAQRAQQTTAEANATSLLSHVFDYHVRPSKATQVFLMGTETGHAAIANFITQNEIVAMERVAKTFHFLFKNRVHSVRSQTSDGLARWHRDNSTVFVAARNGFWKDDPTTKQPKIKNRFGDIKKSARRSWTESWDLSCMLKNHQSEVFKIIGEYMLSIGDGSPEQGLQDDSQDDDPDAMIE